MLTVINTAVKDRYGTIHSLYDPLEHNEIISDRYNNGIDITEGEYIEGFMLSDNTFATREEALLIALEAGQVDSGKTSGFLESGDVRWYNGG